MAADVASDNERHDTHFWIDCPGCGYGGKIGLPLDYPAEVVVCPNCREVVRVKPQDRVLWQPADPVEFLRRRFPGVDWDAVDERATPAGKANAECAGHIDERFPALKTSTTAANRTRKPPRWIDSRILDNQFMQAGLMLAGFVVPLTVTLLLAPRVSTIEQRGEQVAAAPPNATAPGAKTAPTQQAPPAPTAPEPPAADGAAADTPATDEASPPEKPPSPPESAPGDNRPPFRPDPPEIFAPRPPLESDVHRFLTLYNRAARFADDGDDERAIPLLKQIATLDAPDTECLMCRAKAHAFLGDFARAMDDAAAAVERSPRDARPWHTRAMILAQAAKFPAAMSDMIIAVRLATPGRYETQYVKEVTAYAASLAKQVSSQAATATAGGEGAYARSSQHYQLGINEFKHGAYADAVREFTEAIRWKPHSAAAHHWRACALIEVRQFGSALADMNRSLLLRGSYPVAFHARAVVLDHLGRYREAYADIVEALRLSPRNPIYLDYQARLRVKIDERRLEGVELPWTVANRVRASSRWALRVPDLIVVANETQP